MQQFLPLLAMEDNVAAFTFQITRTEKEAAQATSASKRENGF